ncbi:MAG: phosphotransferase [Paludibacteraceae bacterium]|nr:phosphotransferase [Paludibacteraceae bacterium]
MKRLTELFAALYGHEPQQQTAITNSGSNRQYYRISDGNLSVIGVIGTSIPENKAFVSLSRHFSENGMKVPRVLTHTEDFSAYITEDLGSEDLFGLIQQDPSGERTQSLLKQTVAQLPRLQFEGAQGLDFSVCYPIAQFDRRSIFWDLNYFKYEFLKPSGIEPDEVRLEEEFNLLADWLLSYESPTFMYRDFQSRNVMICNGQPYFIDFQGGRKGPFYYDLASFVYQAKAGYSAAQRESLTDCYVEALQPYHPCSKEDFRQQLRPFVLFRLIQVLGAYGFRGLVEHKAHFIQSIIPALALVREFLSDNDFDRLPYLCDLLRQLTTIYPAAAPNDGQLTVEVMSFSYKKGYPTDFSGNGGGYVFDCRSIHNPGRYPEYKNITGRDKPVMDFLEKNGEITVFLQHVYALVDQTVSRYQKRGFTHLQVMFGCTGGQHRSVYAAEHLARHLAEQGVRVRLIHREQHIDITL